MLYTNLYSQGRKTRVIYLYYKYIIILGEATSLVTRNVPRTMEESVYSKLQWNLSITTT